MHHVLPHCSHRHPFASIAKMGGSVTILTGGFGLIRKTVSSFPRWSRAKFWFLLRLSESKRTRHEQSGCQLGKKDNFHPRREKESAMANKICGSYHRLYHVGSNLVKQSLWGKYLRITPPLSRHLPWENKFWFQLRLAEPKRPLHEQGGSLYENDEKHFLAGKRKAQWLTQFVVKQMERQRWAA